jgi:hypothetical protein
MEKLMQLDRSEIAQTYLTANEQANEFARTGLANLVLLNGGAIVAFAPIGSMFGVRIGEVLLWSLGSLALFNIGLILAVFAYLAGFFVNSKLSEMMQYGLVGDDPDLIEKTRQSHNRIRALGIKLALLSVAAFIFGGILGGIAIYCGS